MENAKESHRTKGNVVAGHIKSLRLTLKRTQGKPQDFCTSHSQSLGKNSFVSQTESNERDGKK